MHQFLKKIHMVGIGGAGMCPLAEVLLAHGHTITGSDKVKTPSTVRLETLGIVIQYDHTPNLIASADLLVYSSAVKESNPERVFAREHGIAMMRRAEVLGDLMRAHQTFCVSGTHGKTTTTSILGKLFTDGGMNPTVLVGGIPRRAESHAAIGQGLIMVAEADEFDRSFLAMNPTVAIITNIEADHLDCYRDLDDIKDAFVEFTGRIPFYGSVIACVDDPGVQSVLPRIQRKVITYGLSEQANYRATEISFVNGMGKFTVWKNDSLMGTISLGIPGIHNVNNALASVAAASEAGVTFDSITASLASFEGVHRRFEIVGQARGITVIDDYAHHPGEIRATLEAARNAGYGRVIALFQPHLYTRTRDLMEGFAESLSMADSVVVTAIYKAREEPIEGVSAERMIHLLHTRGYMAAQYIADKDDAAEKILAQAQPGDAIVVMGAGDISETAARLAGRLHEI